MAERSPKHKLIRNGRGWVKRIGGKPRWIVSAAAAPTGEDADAYFEANFADIANDTPVVLPVGVAFRDAAAAFVTERESRKLHPATIRDYDDTMKRVGRGVGGDKSVESLGEPDAAAVIAGIAPMGTHRRAKHVGIIRMFIRWCSKKGLRCGWTEGMFTPPTKAERRRDRAKRKKRPYTPQQLRRLLRHASDRLRLAVLLCLNAAMGPEEVLTLTHEDCRSGVIDKPRQKTGVERRIPLWAETREAIGKGKGPIFAGKGGRVMNATTLMHKFRALCKRACVPTNGLYTLRRTWRTVADDWGDHRAAALVMGRELPDIDTVYVLTVKTERIERLQEHVRTVLRIGSAWAARRRRQGQRHLAARIERRKGVSAPPPEKPDSSARPASSAKSRRPSSRGPSRKR